MKARFLLFCLTALFIAKAKSQPSCNGYMLSFDGTDDYVQLQTSQNFTDAFSVMVNVKVISYPDAGKLYTLISKSSYFAINHADFPFSLILASDGRIYANLSKGDDYLNDGQLYSTSPLSLNEWHTISFVYKANNYASLYIDGVLQQLLAINFAISENTQQWNIGRHSTEYDGGVGTSYFKGYIDEVSIWNTDMGKEEISKWECKAITIDHPDYAYLTSYYKFDEGSGTVLVDQMGDANGIVYGAAWIDGDNSCYIQTSTWYQDADGDSFGNPLVTQVACVQPEGYVADNTDCNDNDGTVHINCEALPIHLISFTGGLQNLFVRFEWHSGMEEHFSHFLVEKSADGNSFSSVAFVSAKGSNSKYVLSMPQKEALAFYRLRMVDKDGKFSYSKVIRLMQDEAAIGLYPNPAGECINIIVTDGCDAAIYDATGVLIQKIRLRRGPNRINTSRLARGVYFLITAGKERLQFIKQ